MIARHMKCSFMLIRSKNNILISVEHTKVTPFYSNTNTAVLRFRISRLLEAMANH